MYKKLPRNTVLLCHLNTRIECAIVPERFQVHLYCLLTLWAWMASIDNKGKRSDNITELLKNIG